MVVIEHALPEVLRWVRDLNETVSVTLVTSAGSIVYRGTIDDVRHNLSEYEAAPHESEIVSVHVQRDRLGP